jgi:hypothetical protein
MITTEFGRLVATGAAIFAFFFLMSYLKLRREVTKSTAATRKQKGWGTEAIGRAR